MQLIWSRKLLFDIGQKIIRKNYLYLQSFYGELCLLNRKITLTNNNYIKY